VWKLIQQSLPAGQLSFLLRAGSDTLPIPVTGLLGGQVVKALDYRPRGPRFQPHYSNRDIFT